MSEPAAFPLGMVVASAGVGDAMIAAEGFNDFVEAALERHARGDWGEALDPEDRASNDVALRDGGRLMSAYPLPADLAAVGADPSIWVITEWDRSATTVLFPSDY